MEQNKSFFPVERMAKTFGVHRSSYYSYLSMPNGKRQRQEKLLLPHIKRSFIHSREEYGSRRIKLDLGDLANNVSKTRINKIMQSNNLIPKARKRFKVTTQQSKKPYYVADNLLNQNFNFNAPNQAWCGDITYVPTDEGWLYVATVIDLFSRKIIGLSMSHRITSDLVLRATQQAINTRKPLAGLIMHSDRGSQYTSKAYHKLAKNNGIRLSMSGKGNCYDNAVAESFFHTLKIAVVHEQKFYSRKHAMRTIFEYVYSFYNRIRIHSTLGYLSPEKFENKYLENFKSVQIDSVL